MDQQTINTYNQMAAEYDAETSSFWEKFPRTFIEEFIKRANGKVLDIGSGPGRDAIMLKDAGIQVVCLDASQSMVEITKSKGLESVLGDFLHMPFESETFDGAWAYTSLLHIPKSEINEALDEISRILKPGGVLGLGLIEGDTEEYRQSSGMSMQRWFSYYRREEIERLLHDHGFEEQYFEEFKPKSKNYLQFIFKKI